ncbi:MAG: DUF2339 domain-containing protein [Sneathiellales bacterium]|nr:DUF2339 domain-containing protein [Sneathiellales bacterium]
MEVLFALLSLIIPLGFLVVFIWLIVKVRALSQDVSVLKIAVSQLLKEGKEAEPEEAPQAYVSQTMPAEGTSIEQESAVDLTSGIPTSQATPDNDTDPQQERNTPPRFSIIEFLTSTRLMIWIGGLALALGGVFIVKYSIERGFLGPWGKVTAGLLAGMIMLLVSEWLRKQVQEEVIEKSSLYLPIAVAAAGFTTIYGALFSAFAFYDLLSALPTILLLALTAAAGLAYSILMGPLLALLALIGAYLAPALVSTENSSTELLYLYLSAIVVGSFLLLRYQGWTWIGVVNLVAQAIWFFLWGAEIQPAKGEIVVLTLHLAVVLSLYVVQFLRSATLADCTISIFRSYRQTDIADRLLYGAVLYALLVGLIITLRNEFAAGALITPVALLLLTCWIAYRNPFLEGTIWISQIGILILAVVWPIEKTPELTPILNQLQISMLVAISFYFIGHALWRLRKDPTSGLPVFYAVYMPLLTFCILYWRYHGIGTSVEWGLVALILAAGYVVWASVQKISSQEILGYLALGTSGGLSLAFSAFMSNEWLTIAFALQVFALSWINKFLTVRLLRPIAALLAIIVIVRLELDSDFIRTLIGAQYAVDWYLYGFGIPLLAFGGAWIWFSREKEDYLTYLLESGFLLFWVSILTTMIRINMLQVGTGTGMISFAETAIHVGSWGLNALGLYWLASRAKTVVREMGWKILGTAAGIALVYGLVFILNPAFRGMDAVGTVGKWYILDWLMLAYLFPALMLAVSSRIVRTEHIHLKPYLLGGAAVLGFLYLNTEIRHLFQGEDIKLWHMSDQEIYSYSIGWLVYASAIMGIGIWKDDHRIRQAALLLLLATVVKVFFFDMGALEGLLRAISFLGLGACLIGLAFLYQKFGKGESEKIS